MDEDWAFRALPSLHPWSCSAHCLVITFFFFFLINNNINPVTYLRKKNVPLSWCLQKFVLGNKWDNLWFLKAEILSHIVNLFATLTVLVCWKFASPPRIIENYVWVAALCSTANHYNHRDHAKWYFSGFLISIKNIRDLIGK